MNHNQTAERVLTPAQSALIERLLNAEPGARQEAAAEIRRLTASLAAMERERDAWRYECKVLRLRKPALHGPCTQLQCGPCLIECCAAMARAATDALMKQSPESAPKEPPHA